MCRIIPSVAESVGQLKMNPRKSACMGGNIWLLEAKSFAQDPRPEEARALKAWLCPGEYAVGKLRKKCDIVITGDKSVSSQHAKLIVPGQRDSDNRPVEERTDVLRVVDTSKFGTLVTNKCSDVGNLEIQGTIHDSMEVYDGMFVKFGQLSVFRVKRLSLSPVYHPVLMDSNEGKAMDIMRLFGIDAWNSGMEKGKNTLLVCAEKQEVDGTILLAIFLGASVVSVTWLKEWNTRKVWIGGRPKEEDFPVDLYACKSRDRLGYEDPVLPKTVHHSCSVSNSRRAKKVFGKYTFVWPWEEKSLSESDFFSVLDLLHVRVDYTVINDMENKGIEKLKEDHVLILKECKNKSEICKKFKHCCTVESMIAAILTGHFHIQGHSDAEGEISAMDVSEAIDTDDINLGYNKMESIDQHIGRIESTDLKDRANADGWVDVIRDASHSVLDDESSIIQPSCPLTQTIECTTVVHSQLKSLGSFGTDKRHKKSCGESDSCFELPNYKAFRPKEPPVQSGVLVPMEETVYITGNKGYNDWVREEEKRLELERRKDILFDREPKPTKRKPRQVRSRK